MVSWVSRVLTIHHRKRQQDAEARGLTYKPRTSGYTPRSKAAIPLSVSPNRSTSPTPTSPVSSTQLASVATQSVRIEQWQSDFLPGLDHGPDLDLPSSYVQSLRVVGTAIKIWEISYPSISGLFCNADWDSKAYAEACLIKEHLQLSVGLFVEYEAVRTHERTVKSSAEAAGPILSSLENARALCPMQHLQPLLMYTARCRERVACLHMLASNLDLTRRLFLGTGRPEHIKSWLCGAVESVLRQGYKLQSPPPMSFLLDSEQLARLAPRKWISDEIINFMGSIWNEEHDTNDTLILPTTFASLHLDIGKTYTLRDPAKAIRHGRLKDALETRDHLWSRMLIPFGLKQHFMVLLISTAECSIVLYDSLTDHNALRKGDLAKLKQPIIDFVTHLCVSKKWKVPDEEWDVRYGTDVPQQPNAFDCGVFSLLFMRHLTLSSNLNSETVPLQLHFPRAELQGDANGPRLAILEEILEKSSHVKVT
ncbi:hypothetical protein EV715DRAFT_278457 [Schizophyllum commune]